jgi:adenylate cyclase
MDSNSLTWFLMEARRRQLVGVLAIYVVGAWVLLQVAATLFPGWLIPEQAIRYVWIGAVMQFPIVLVLGWYYDLSAQGIRRTSPAGADTKCQDLTRQDYGVLSLIALFSAGIMFGVVREVLDTRELRLPQVAVTEYPQNSIAVLPFLNLSDISEQEHFADGLTEELLNSLAATDGLRVISRTSSFAYKGSPLSAKEIAAQLNVEHILEGSVRRTGNMIRVTAQLINAQSDSHLWSRNYDDVVGAENIFKVQENIASLVTDSLQVRLMPRNMPKAPASIETLDLYYDGLFVFNELKNGQDLSDEKFTKAASKFEAAIEAEPDWLPAFVKLGQLYHWWSAGGYDREKLQTSRRYITEALRRDPQNAEANHSLGYILWAEGDFKGSLHAYDKAEQLGAISGWGRAITLSNLGRFDEAVAAYQESVPVHPVSLELRRQLTSAMYCAGQYLAIVSNEDDLITTWPEDEEGVKPLLALSHARLGNREKALAFVDEETQRWQTEAYLADLFAIIGEHERARRAIDELVERDVGLVHAATAALILGERGTALDLLENQLEKQSSASNEFLFCEPEIRALAGNARYDAMLESRGLLAD